ncbi:MAG: FAD-dependent oxidoreductase [Candidatus Verstraetearchaeota archaeon]|nr:FAD-dependent oxidoreductase [Candidatus Verstraetearchaeota archaeon]
MELETDVLVIGGGLAGLCAAISSASDLSKTAIVTKTIVGGGNTTAVAAGILSAVTPFGDPGDSTDLHFQDTLRGGRMINDRELSKVMVRDASKYFSRLMGLGIEFEEDGGEIKAYPIPGHSKPRSYYMKGRASNLQRTLRSAAEGLGVRFVERTMVTGIVKEGKRAVGAVGARTDTGEPVAIKAKAIVVATGGSGEIYSKTLMPAGSSGYGCSLAFRAGAELVDMEFVQFYPMMVSEEGLPRLFIDYPQLLMHGGDVVDGEGNSIFKRHGITEPWKLTRDAFSILIAKETLGGGSERKLFLDCRGIKDSDLESNPALMSAVKDLEARRVPLRSSKVGISPYAHFMMGGIKTDANGATSVQGLYAAGEAAGGVHGANRIGGNAFAAAIAFGFRSGMAASMYASTVDQADPKTYGGPSSQPQARGGEVGAKEAISMIRETMWNDVGIIRDAARLREALATFNRIREEGVMSTEPLEHSIVQMMLDMAEVTAMAASLREESRGAHYRSDFPHEDENWMKRIVFSLKGGNCEITQIPVE